MKYLFLIITLSLTILVISINVKLRYGNDTFEEKQTDIIHQLNFLESELKSNNLGSSMQHIFPEGLVFVNALYGLSWCELALADSSNNKKIKEKAVDEALFAYNQIDSEQAKCTFDHYLVPENGIFYFGWQNYLLSKILAVDTTFKGHESYIDSFSVHCETLKNILNQSETPYLQSYFHQAWPADMFVAMASLSNHDKVFNPKYKTTITSWLGKVKNHLDKQTQMIPHSVDPETGEQIEGSRGCSMSLILRMLAEMDSSFANQQYKRFENSFVSKTIGLPSVREYPKGTHGMGDVDSGPVIFGVGFSATINMIGTYASLGKYDLAEKQCKTIHAFGFAHDHANKKSYLFGKLPIADAFIAWGHATNMQQTAFSRSCKWSIEFHVISLFVILFVWMVYFRKWIIKLINSASNK
jgi:hypothetical protein